MKQIYILSSFVLLLLGWGCGKEDDLQPSGYGKDWMVIEEPDNDDPVDRLRWEIYRDFGISTYYNDTIGSEERVDVTGKPYTHHEVLKVYYFPGTTNYQGSNLYKLMEDHLKLEPVLRFLKDEIFPRFDESVYFPAFLFADSLGMAWDDIIGNNRVDYYYGFNAMVVNADSLKDWGTEKFCSEMLVNYFVGRLSSSNQKEWFDHFLNVSKMMNSSCQFIYSISSDYGTKWEEAFAGTNFTEKEELGFISTLWIVPYWGNPYWATPMEKMDLEDYVRAVLAQTTADFRAKYGEYKPVMEKFMMMKSKLQELGYHTLE